MQRVVLDPFVALSIVEHYMRHGAIKSEDEYTRTDGILLGSHIKNVTEVRNFVPGFEDDFIRLTIRASPRDMAVGWYATELSSADKALQEKIDENVDRPVFLFVHVPSEEDPTIKFRAFVKNTITFSSGDSVTCQKEIPCDIVSSNLDSSVALDAIVGSFFPNTAAAADPARVPSTASGDDTYTHLKKVNELLTVAKSYVKDVSSGKIVGDKATGRKLSALLAETESKQRAAAASGITETKTEDALMLQYLGRLLERQVKKIEDSYSFTPAPATETTAQA